MPPPAAPLHLAADLLRRVRLVELQARRRVEDLLTGRYRSVFRGRGLEFDDLREYQPGDDVRSIDWHATARTGTVQIKRHVEERCLTLLVAVDVSASGAFASGSQAKIELAAELTATFALSAALENDRAGLLLFSDRVERFIPPGTGRHHALELVATLLAHSPASPRTRIRQALNALEHATRRRATIFLVSDFLDPDPDLERALRIASRRHDLVAVPVHDPAEDSLPDVGWLTLEDAESGERTEVNTSDPAFRRAHELQRLARASRLQDLFRRTGIDSIPCVAGRPWQLPLLHFFERRLGLGRSPAPTPTATATEAAP